MNILFLILNLKNYERRWKFMFLKSNCHKIFDVNMLNNFHTLQVLRFRREVLW